MKQDWKIRQIGELCTVIAGQSPEGRYYNADGDGLPFYQGKKEFTDKFLGPPTTWTTSTTKVANKGDILMSVRAPVGPVNFATDKICIGRGLAAIRPSNSINSDFLFSFLQLHENKLEGNAGAVFNSINKSQIEAIEIPLPPLPEQKRIVAILDEAFAAIEKAKANAEKNLRNAKELFESYLNNIFKDKVAGSKFETLAELCDLIVDCEHKTAPIQKEGYPSIRTTNIGKGELLLENVNRVSHEVYIKWTRRATPKSGDLILAREAPAGNIAVIPDNLKVCLGQRTVLIRPSKDKFRSKYLAFLILSKQVQEALLSHSTGATVQHINLKDIRSFKIYNRAAISEQTNILSGIEKVKSETYKLESIYESKINDLDELKKSILQKAFTGELTDKKELVS